MAADGRAEMREKEEEAKRRDEANVRAYQERFGSTSSDGIRVENIRYQKTEPSPPREQRPSIQKRSDLLKKSQSAAAEKKVQEEKY